MDVETARTKILNHKSEELRLQKEKEEQEELLLNDLIQQIQSLQPRIKQIIEIGNLCIENGINLNKRGTYRNCLYKEDAYETDAIYHQLGFFPNHYRGHPHYTCSKYDYIGYRMGGACGGKDFITNGDVVLHISHDNYSSLANPSLPSIRHCQMFLEDFPKFEKVFYEFIEKL